MKRRNILQLDGNSKIEYVKEIKSKSNELTVFDVPYLRPDSIKVLDMVLKEVLKDEVK